MKIPAFFRHLYLYLWKNALQKGRNGGVTCCELATPIVLVGLFAALYAAVSINTYSQATYECDVHGTDSIKYGFEYMPRALNLTATKLGIVGEPTMRGSFIDFLTATYPGLSASVLAAANCTLAQQEVSLNGAPMGFEGFNASRHIMQFDTEQQLETYIAADQYGMNDQTPGVYAAVVFMGGSNSSQWTYKLRFNSSATPDTRNIINTYSRGVTWANINNYLYGTPFSNDMSNHPLPFYMPGFVQLQTTVDKFIINATANGTSPTLYNMTAEALNFYSMWGCLPADLNVYVQQQPAVETFLTSRLYAPQHVSVTAFPISEYTDNDFYTFVSNVFALIFVLSFFFPSFFLIRGMVVEKETKIREGMRMMGLGDAALFTAWYITYGIIFFIIAVVISILTSATFFSHSDGGLIFLYFFLFGMSAVSLCFLLSTFFSKSKLASAVGAVIFIATFFPYYQVSDPMDSPDSKNSASLLSPVAFGLAIDILSTLESNGVGLHWSNAYTTINGYSFGSAMTFMVFDFILYTVLGIYLGNVLPQDFGVPMPFYYPFTKRYWQDKLFCCQRGGNRRTQTRGKHGMVSLNGDGGALLDNMADGDATMGSPLPFPGAKSRFEEIALAQGDMMEQPGIHLRDLAREGRVVSIRGLAKEFATPDGIKRAVDGLSLDMFESQCFVLLGHNGAGKSTTISMLTGLIPPTEGDAYMYGLSMREDMQDIRHSLGVCPQHDVLWPDITVKEHLVFFAGIKGVPRKDVEEIVMRMIKEVGLLEKTDVKSAELSGGQKRKLSVAIALIGGSKIVFLDEPTSGMDPYSRRFTWNLLQSNRAGRVMVLTTHFMDEADVLGDRIGIMANGDIRCCGSSMYLKKKYGVGYNLTVVKAANCDSNALEAIIARHLTEYRVLSNVGSEMSFQVSLGSSHAFPDLFHELESHIVKHTDAATGAASVRILTYGISVTTLEEVFLRVAEEGPGHTKESQEDLQQAKAKMVAEKEQRMSQRQGNTPQPATTGAFAGGKDEYTRAKHDTNKNVFFRHFKALICKRWKYALRDRRAMVFQLLIPVLALLVGLLLLKQVNSNTLPPLNLQVSMFNPSLQTPQDGTLPPNYIPFIATPESSPLIPYFASSGNVPGGVYPAGSAANATFVPIAAAGLNSLYNLSSYTVPADCNNTDYGGFPLPNWVLVTEDMLHYDPIGTWQLSRFMLDSKSGVSPVNQQTFNPVGASTFGAYIVNGLQKGDAPSASSAQSAYAAYTVLVNTTAYHALPTYIAAMHSALYNWVTGGTVNASIAVTSAPLPYTKFQVTIINTATSFVAVLFIVIAFSFIPASFAVFIVKEAEVKCKHQQLLSGVSIPAYWCATYAWDIINYTFPCAAAIILIVAFNVTELVEGTSLIASILLFLFYGTSVASFTYLLTYLYKSHSTAQTMTLIMNLLCVILLLASFVMQQIDATCPADSALKFVYRLLPGYSLGNGLLQLSLLKTLPWLQSDCGRLSVLERVQQKFDAFSMDVTGYSLLYMILQSFIYFGLAILIDVLLSFPAIRARVLPDKDVSTKPYEEDDDVTAEARRVDAGQADTDVIRLQHLRKVYKGGKLAVKNLTFGIPQGEVFGFLGINGAGKTTTLKMLSGDEIPTRGTAKLGQYDILTQQLEVRRLLGYCPQFDALLDLLTTREHLELFARIKGVPESALAGVVDAKLHEMDLVQYANKLAGSLSGGNKRKLSVAIAMIGDPPLIFLDEPSTGMDPVARRFMWNVISRIATERQQCSIILTTHSMEECEALCTRVGIMVNGKLACLGPIQHLKRKFGRGYMALVKVSTPPQARIDAVLAYLQPYLDGNCVPMARLRECCVALGDETRFAMIHPAGSGWALSAALQRDKRIEAVQFAEWWAQESIGAHLHHYFTTAFPGAKLLERHGEFFSYQLPELGIPLSQLFRAIEAEKARLHISEYSLSQTSLESIFNTMAAQDDNPGMGAAPGMGATTSAASAAVDSTPTPPATPTGYPLLNTTSTAAATTAAPSGAGLLQQVARVFVSEPARPHSIQGVEFQPLMRTKDDMA